MSYRHKFQHINNHTNVDPCYDSYKYSITTREKQWTLNKYPGSSSLLQQSTILSMWRRLKLGNSYLIYNIVDLFHTDTNLSTTTTIQMWIHAMTYRNTPSQHGESNYHFNRYSGPSSHLPQSTIISIWIHVLKSNMVETTWLPVNDENR